MNEDTNAPYIDDDDTHEQRIKQAQTTSAIRPQEQ